jgi:AcrR family transcriptional regulator
MPHAAALPPATEAQVLHIRDALASGELGESDLTARKLGAALGKTTGAVYHHWGSLDGLLFEVSQAGFQLLLSRLSEVHELGGDLADVAEGFVTFGLDYAVLYRLMFERHFDWAALREAGAMDQAMPGVALWAGVIERLATHGSTTPDLDARLLYAGLHGLVSLAQSGRANVGALQVPDRDIAITAARALAQRVATAACRKNQA